MVDAYRMWEALGSIGMSTADIKRHIELEAEREPPPAVGRPRVPAERIADIKRQFKHGATLEEIGSLYGCTREWIRQILKREGIIGKDGGQHVKSEVTKQLRKADTTRKKDTRLLGFYGCTAAEMDVLNEGRKVSDHTSRAMQYRNQMRSAEVRGIEWRISFPEWVKAWEESGKFEQRGRGADKYVMARKGDTGAYEPGNIEFITLRQNSVDARTHTWAHGKQTRRDELNLSPRQRTAFDLYRAGYTTAPEIAAQMRVCYGTAYAYLTRAKKAAAELEET